MDFTSSWFILVLTLVGGVVAVFADSLGRRLGKRKLRLGKLRPRHTAILLTGVSGALVTIITITLVAVFSAEVRQLLIEGREAVKNAQRSKGELEKLRAQLSDLSVLKNDSNEQLRKKQAQLGSANNDLEKRRVEIVQLKGTFERDKLQFSRQSAAFQGRLVKLERLMKDRESALRKLTASMDQADKIYKQLDAVYKGLEANYKTLQANFKAQSDMNGELDDRNAELDKSNEKLAQDNEKLNAEGKRLAEQSNDLNRLITTQQTKLSLIEENFKTESVNTRLRPVTFEMGEEFTRREVADILTLDDARETVRQALASARGRVDQRSGMGAFLFYSTDEKGVAITEQQHRENLARKLLQIRGQSVVVVSALINVFTNDQSVPLDVNIYANPVVFQQGQVLGETRVDGGLAESRIVQQITDLLQTTVRQKAMDAKMIPNGIRNSTFGNIDPDETIRIVTQIKEFGRAVRLQVLAKDSTRAAGPLNIEFRVR